jgi:hypothetical protein
MMPEWQSLKSEEEYVAPRTELEKSLAKIWGDILHLPRIGVLDNFFDLGGHSLLAMQVVSRIRTTVRVELSLRVFFENLTVASLAEHLETMRWIANERTAISTSDLAETEKIML